MIKSQLITMPTSTFNYVHQHEQRIGEEPVHYRNYFKEALQKQQERTPFDPNEI